MPRIKVQTAGRPCGLEKRSKKSKGGEKGCRQVYPGKGYPQLNRGWVGQGISPTTTQQSARSGSLKNKKNNPKKKKSPTATAKSNNDLISGAPGRKPRLLRALKTFTLVKQKRQPALPKRGGYGCANEKQEERPAHWTAKKRGECRNQGSWPQANGDNARK